MKKTDLDVIRVETALSRFPIHRLAKVGTVEIAIREQNDVGNLVQWEVSHNAKFGQPGPLAYKLDTLIINRRVEEVGRPIPKLVRLGSLNNIARELGLFDSGKNRVDIKQALYQNAGAFITAKVRYKAVDGSRKSIEFGTTRYAVVLTGETLPDGRRADAVYAILHDLYREILDTALTRPLNYEYLRTLPPVPQRLYELLSFQMYAALRNGHPTARLSYAGFCLHAPQTRYEDFDRIKKQMHKLHAPHRQSGYIAGVAYEATTDREGRPDWTMIYTPGPKAKVEYKAFTRRGGSVVLDIEPALPEPELESEPTGLERELIDRGVTPSQAVELVRDFPENRIREQIENLDGRRRKVKDPGAWLASAIRKGYAMKAEPAATQVEPVAVVDRAERDRVRAAVAYWEGLTAEERKRIDAEALAHADPETKADFEAETRPALRRMKLVALRHAYLETVGVVG